MALKKYKPVTAGTRWRIGNAYAEITTTYRKNHWLNQLRKPVVVIHKVVVPCAILVAVVKKCIV
jgi:hypothetical protein